MKIVSIGHSFTRGGAARAAGRVNAALRVVGLDVEEVALDTHREGLFNAGFTKTAALWEHRLWRACRVRDYRSVGSYGAFDARFINSLKPDIVLLHWIARGTVALDELSSIDVPVVWVMHDLWPVLGFRHYEGATLAGTPTATLVERFVANRKRTLLSHVHLVAPSSWTQRVAMKLARRDVSLIPYPVDPSDFVPVPRNQARAVLGLPKDAFVLGFADLAGVKDARKGWQVLSNSLQDMQVSSTPGILAVAGTDQIDPIKPRGHWDAWALGRLQTTVELSRFYSACDVVAIPSLEDTVNQVATEAQMCGTPVVAFRNTGVGATLLDSPGSILASEMTQTSFTFALGKSIESGPSDRRLTREWATSMWSPSIIGRRYFDLFSELA